MALPQVHSYTDAIDALSDWVSGYGASAPQSLLRRCIRSAYHEIRVSHDWSFLYANGRIQLKAAESAGTIEYDHTGGANERQLILTHASAVWPDWAKDAAVRIGDVVSDVESRESDTVLILDSVMNPGQDVAAGTSFVIYPRWYILPADFQSFHGTMAEAAWMLGQPLSPNDMLALDRYRGGTGAVNRYAIGAAQDLYGSLAVYVYPASDTTETCDFMYKRRPRELRYSGKASADYTGTIGVTAGSATVTGDTTAFASAMAGSLLRISSSASTPTGLEGLNPWVEQRVIKSVENTGSLTLDAGVGTTRDGVGYVIADPIDMHGDVYEALLRSAEMHLGMARNVKDKASLHAMARDALFKAKMTDPRVEQRQRARVGQVFVGRLADSTDRPVVEV